MEADKFQLLWAKHLIHWELVLLIMISVIYSDTYRKGYWFLQIKIINSQVIINNQVVVLWGDAHVYSRDRHSLPRAPKNLAMALVIIVVYLCRHIYIYCDLHVIFVYYFFAIHVFIIIITTTNFINKCLYIFVYVLINVIILLIVIYILYISLWTMFVKFCRVDDMFWRYF